jgi:hypothetical protein
MGKYYFQLEAEIEMTPGNIVKVLARVGPFTTNSIDWFNRLYCEWPEDRRNSLAVAPEPRTIQPLPNMVDMRNMMPIPYHRSRSVLHQLRNNYARYVETFAHESYSRDK